MSLYENWTENVIQFVKAKGETAFWKEYGKIETKFYTKILGERNKVIKGKLGDLASEFEISDIYFVGVLDGINESLVNPLELDSLELDTEIDVEIDFEKLYFNMLDAKADYLFTLSQWDGIFSVEKRKEIQKQYRDSKTIVKENKIGRNDPCPCGSGKKYKKCCGKSA